MIYRSRTNLNQVNRGKHTFIVKKSIDYKKSLVITGKNTNSKETTKKWSNNKLFYELWKLSRLPFMSSPSFSNFSLVVRKSTA